MSERDERSKPLHLFEGFGIEIEHMIVDTATLAVKPIADELLRDVGGGYDMEVDRGAISWSNELALHVIETKTNGPAPSLGGLGATFQDHIGQIRAILGRRGATLLPTAMHPLMDPEAELRLWPHEDDIIYRTFDRIFDCRGHGWANLQSTHINLPFQGDDEFGRLHAAIRLVLPIIPALAASSPVADGRITGRLDTRLEAYRNNSQRVPSVAGHVIPEPVYSRAEYEGRLLASIYADLAAHDPDRVICHEWVNARGCIARFDRSAIEIRIIDVQECPAADIAVAGAIVSAVRGLVEEHWTGSGAQRHWPVARLAEILLRAIRSADETVIRDADYLRSFGYPEPRAARASELWQHLIEAMAVGDSSFSDWQETLDLISRRGCLARRIVAALGPVPGRGDLVRVYRQLGDCLAEGRPFGGQ